MQNPRSRLTNAFTEAWTRTVDRRYNSQDDYPDINSEAALQAYFVAELIPEISRLDEELKTKTRIFIEPNFGSIIPDVVICRGGRVIAVVELKYVPRLSLTQSNLENDAALNLQGLKKDVESLETLYRVSREVEQTDAKISGTHHERFRGNFSSSSGTRFTLSKNTLFVWAGFHNTAESNLPLKKVFNDVSDLQGMLLLEMHAVTLEREKAQTWFYFDGQVTRTSSIHSLPGWQNFSQ